MYVQCCVISICYDKPFWYFEQRYQEKRKDKLGLSCAKLRLKLVCLLRLD
jgi:hypothetical protein